MAIASRNTLEGRKVSRKVVASYVHFIRYVFVLDIFCQQLWGVVQLGGVCVPFGHRVGSCTFS